MVTAFVVNFIAGFAFGAASVLGYHAFKFYTRDRRMEEYEE